MNNLDVMRQLILADFRERTRRYSFLLTLLGALFLGYLVITGKYSIQFNDYRALYNSAWLGTLMAVTCSTMLSIAGFYLVKNSISRDRRSKVGQIIAATPLGNVQYLVSKFISNLLVLLSMIGILAVVAFIMLIFRNETDSIEFGAFIAPFIFMAVPAMALVAAMAVFFDTVRWLRGSAGNVIYLFAVEMMLVSGLMMSWTNDLGGINLFVTNVEAVIKMAYPGVKVGMQMGFIGLVDNMAFPESNIFLWEGINWNWETILLRLLWVGAALFVIALAIPFFDRFDPARDKIKTRRKKTSRASLQNVPVETGSGSSITYASIDRPVIGFSPVHMLSAELHLMVKGFHWSWYMIAAGLIVSQFLAPFDITRKYITPLAMAWPLILWSSMGTRESRYDTGQLLFSSPMPFKRQFPAIWLAGLGVALLAVSPMAVRAFIGGHWSYTATLLIAALFASSMALALGTLSGGRKIFEVVYLFIWYAGSIDHVVAIDILGTTDMAITGIKMSILILLSVGFLSAAFMSRYKQING